MATVTICSDFGAQEKKVCHCFHFFPFYLPWSDGTRCHDLSFWMLSFKPAFSLSSFTLINRLFSSSSLSAIRVVISAYLRSSLEKYLFWSSAHFSIGLVFYCCCYWAIWAICVFWKLSPYESHFLKIWRRACIHLQVEDKIIACMSILWGLPWWLSSEESACNAGTTGDSGSIPWVGKIPCRRA